ncbi:hypothetical protein PFICI_03678 [Pestalotiopsis fici W106-1]|uniref:Zn(2)-C6 fungal-type domain-containing protein n=1 Tax=Pestalotiopsis fici (strain W106-1 / CGMCC3.15140) TaxID=1229662 RepID=W3XHV2_PESFW|nr:uncharacterized protein PFICI_03678 [Pestalotiopsis fici W106-1]ETS85653.1 hypothetical protein PFICI_03678 [Pestalotiopsis fici W106-1]
MPNNKAKSAPRTNLVKRACDACKIRKVKCSETSPCRGCVASGIACTFKRLQATRGPRTLRAKTIQKISAAQTAPLDGFNDDNHHSLPVDAPVPGIFHFDAARPIDPPRQQTTSLVHALEIYRQRLYPIWPIVNVDELMHALASNTPLSNLLATTIRLATIAQLRLETLSPDEVPRTSLEDHDNQMSLDVLRVAFFLHIYHENQTPGGGKSLLYLRQAITISQMMRLERESSYDGLPETEQQMRRRVLWLLFVTERGVAMLHKLPVILKPAIILPTPVGDDQAHVLPAFLKLVNLFWMFDQSGIFDILQNSDSDLSNLTTTARGCLGLLQDHLQDNAIDYDSSNDVQKADIFVTRQWMRAVLWRAAVRFGVATMASSPIRIAKEFLNFMSHLPKTAIEAHGPTMEFKTYDIATAVIDAVKSNNSVNPADQAEEVLLGLQKILSSSRGGNKSLVASLYLRMASIAPNPVVDLGSSGRIEEQPEETEIDPNRSPFSGTLLHPSAWAELEEILADTNILRPSGSTTPNYHSLDQQNQQMSWPPLDFSTPLVRTPSPLTRMVFEQIRNSNEEMGTSTAAQWQESTS